MENILTISFTPEKNDYVSASRLLSNQSKWFLIFAAVMVLVMLGSILLLVFPNLGPSNLQSTAKVFLVIGLFYIFHYFVIIPMQLGRSFAANEHLQAKRVLTFFESHLRMEVGEHAIDLPWETLKKVLTNKDFYMLVFEIEEPVYPLIPPRAFGDEETKQKFLDILQEKSALT